ncbi:MAG: NAD(P)/FAD-dependent oxidoreductase [Crenarchaeota archaeon]|nr:NAD(P)/FAD-dependent oxidoreductase [Thermoproteota archaeon]
MSSASQEFDVIVIGSGPSGRNVSTKLAEKKLSVSIIESELVGGDCHYWACIPSKALLRPPEALQEAKAVPGAKQAIKGSLSNEDVFKRRDFLVDNWVDNRLQKSLEQRGITVLHGKGRLNGTKKVAVLQSNGAQTELVAKIAVVLATGSSAAMPNIQGLTEVRPWISRDITSAKAVPASLAIIGGGIVACEMASAWSALGTQVTIIEHGERLLNRYEPFVGKQIMAIFQSKGINAFTKTNVQKVKRGQQNYIELVLGNGNLLVAEELLVAAGRQPNTQDLGLETVNLTPGNWVEVDDRCLVKGVNGQWLYAVGDINHRALVTHAGKYQAKICAHNILTHQTGAEQKSSVWSKIMARSDLFALPQVIFTDPQVAMVGLTEENALNSGLKVHAVDYDLAKLAGAKLHSDEYHGQARIVVDGDRQVLVGATFIGPQVGELLHAATVAIVGEVQLDRLWHVIPAFPTISEVWLGLLESYGI